MSHHTCCNKQKVKRGLWSPEEDEKLVNYISTFGHGCWSTVPRLAGLQRCGKSCRLRWINYLRPDLKRGNFTPQEAALIIELHRLLGNRWAQIAKHIPGRTDNEVKNFWNSSIKKKIMAHHNMSLDLAAAFSQNLPNHNPISSNETLYMIDPNLDQIDHFESRIDHGMDCNASNLGLMGQDSSSLSDHLPSWPISCNPQLYDQNSDQILYDSNSGQDFHGPKPDNLVGCYQGSAFLDALMPELAEVAKAFEYGINSPVLQEQVLDGGPESGFGPLHPNHIKNISSLMASFAAPLPSTAEALPAGSYLPPLPGSFGVNPSASTWAPQP